MACRNSRDPDTTDLEAFAHGDLQDLATHRLAGRDAQSARHHDRRGAIQGGQRRPVEMVRVAVRDDDEIHVAELARIGQGTVPLQRPEPIAQERIGQDTPLYALEQDRRMPDVADLQRRRTHGRGSGARAGRTVGM